jgi:hypothetical protein
VNYLINLIIMIKQSRAQRDGILFPGLNAEIETQQADSKAPALTSLFSSATTL